MYRNDELAIEGWGNSVLPDQYNDMIRRSTGLDGEHRLLWAVLEDAIRSFLANRRPSTRPQRIAYEEARAWLFAPENSAQDAFQLSWYLRPAVDKCRGPAQGNHIDVLFLRSGSCSPNRQVALPGGLKRGDYPTTPSLAA